MQSVKMLQTLSRCPEASLWSTPGRGSLIQHVNSIASLFLASLTQSGKVRLGSNATSDNPYLKAEVRAGQSGHPGRMRSSTGAFPAAQRWAPRSRAHFRDAARWSARVRGELFRRVRVSARRYAERDVALGTPRPPQK